MSEKIYKDISVGNYYCGGYLKILRKKGKITKEQKNQLNSCDNLIKAGQDMIEVYKDYKLIFKSCEGCFKLI